MVCYKNGIILCGTPISPFSTAIDYKILLQAEIRQVVNGDGTAQVSSILRQRNAYQIATDVSKGALGYHVMPLGSFIIHDLHSEVAATFRCEWSNEYLLWADRDQPPLYYVLAKQAMDRNASNTLKNGLLSLGANAAGKLEYLRLFNNTSACKGCTLHYLPFFRPSGEKGYDADRKNTA